MSEQTIFDKEPTSHPDFLTDPEKSEPLIQAVEERIIAHIDQYELGHPKAFYHGFEHTDAVVEKGNILLDDYFDNSNLDQSRKNLLRTLLQLITMGHDICQGQDSTGASAELRSVRTLQADLAEILNDQGVDQPTIEAFFESADWRQVEGAILATTIDVNAVVHDQEIIQFAGLSEDQISAAGELGILMTAADLAYLGENNLQRFWEMLVRFGLEIGAIKYNPNDNQVDIDSLKRFFEDQETYFAKYSYVRLLELGNQEGNQALLPILEELDEQKRDNQTRIAEKNHRFTDEDAQFFQKLIGGIIDSRAERLQHIAHNRDNLQDGDSDTTGTIDPKYL